MALNGCPTLNVVRLNHNALTTVAGLKGEIPTVVEKLGSRHGSVLNFIFNELQTRASSAYGFPILLIGHALVYAQ